MIKARSPLGNEKHVPKKSGNAFRIQELITQCLCQESLACAVSLSLLTCHFRHKSLLGGFGGLVLFAKIAMIITSADSIRNKIRASGNSRISMDSS